ncbi:hypothetical protein M407DRAFT_33522 [Tulasnella calospora MUT 4182]|uniref:Uncharacterized protein n=1 Tax=Tulasnella calospora MUT 4182 TaxID=1051891 RepID=A0A0C3K647_9AGAM|nr:hypothetical protein M407DRAFT_33522 [Tulasnella calospora MUT 4182]
MSSNPNATGTAKVKRATRGQIAIQAAAASNPEVGEATTANGRKLRDTMAAKNGAVAENILREQTLEREFTAAGGTVTDGVNAQSRLNGLRIPVDAAGRSPSSLVAATSSSPLAEEDRFSYRRGPPQTPTRTPSHLSTVVQSQDSPGNTSNLTAAPARTSQTLRPSASTSVAQQTTVDANASSRPPNTRGAGDAPPIPGNARPSRAPPPNLTAAPAHPSQTLQPSASTSIAQRTSGNVDAGSHPSNTRQSEATTTGQGNAQPNQAPVPPPSTPTPAPPRPIVPAQPAPPRPSTSIAQHTAANVNGGSRPSNTQQSNTTMTGRGNAQPHQAPAPPPSTSMLPSAQPAPPRPIAPAWPIALAHGGRPTTSTPNLRDPWAQPRDAPVRVEVRKYEDFDNHLAPASIQYVSVPLVSQLGGVFSCKLSDILGPLAAVESPLKERTTRIYRVGPLAELVTLGHGSEITDPGSTRLVNNPFIDTHEVARTEWNGMEMFTGVKIYYEQRPMQTVQHGSQRQDLPERNPASQSRPLPRAKQSTITSSSTSGKKRSRQQRSRSTSDRSDADSSDSPPFDPKEELYPFLRRILGLDPQDLPGPNYRCSDTVPADDEDGEPGDEDIPIPETIRGKPITKQHLQHVFGFSGGTTWWTLGQRWSKKELRGAKIVYAWSQNPDDTVVNHDTREEEARYPHLNKLLFNRLKSVIALDKAGKYTRHGPIEESDESEEVDYRARDRDRRPHGSHSGEHRVRRRGSSSPRTSRRGTSGLDSEEIDNDQGNGGRSGKRSRGGR